MRKSEPDVIVIDDPYCSWGLSDQELRERCVGWYDQILSTQAHRVIQIPPAGQCGDSDVES